MALANYKLPFSLVRCLRHSEDGKLAVVQYQYGSFYDGPWRAWLPEGARGNAYYQGVDIPFESVVLTDVERVRGAGSAAKPKFTTKYHLSAATIRRLSEVEGSQFQLFLAANATEPNCPARTAQAAARPEECGMGETVMQDGRDTDTEASDSEAEEPPVAKGKPAVSRDSDEDTSSSSDSGEEVSPTRHTKTPPPPKKQKGAATAKGKARTTDGAEHSMTAHFDDRRHKKDLSLIHI